MILVIGQLFLTLVACVLLGAILYVVEKIEGAVAGLEHKIKEEDYAAWLKQQAAEPIDEQKKAGNYTPQRKWDEIRKKQITGGYKKGSLHGRLSITGFEMVKGYKDKGIKTKSWMNRLRQEGSKNPYQIARKLKVMGLMRKEGKRFFWTGKEHK